MKISKTIAVLMVMMLFSIPAGAEDGPERKSRITDIITEPIEIIISPLLGGDLADIIMRPAELLFSNMEPSKLAATPGRTNEYVYNINKNVTVITEEDIRNSDPKNVQELLGRSVGVTVSGYKGTEKDNNVDIRGFGEAGPQNVLVMIDGRRINQIDLSASDMSQVDINSIERIEII
ncbi:MAG: Plug domain-containing protein, partial [Candidatus Omnitrophica bacterium]|nr:Plug domain-containing protein [Candidatus Omnitrophota bacterium]